MYFWSGSYRWENVQIYWERMQICNLALFLSFTCANKIALLQIEAFNLLSVRIHIIERTVFKKKKKTFVRESFRQWQSRMEIFPITSWICLFFFSFNVILLWFTDSPNKLCVNINRPVWQIQVKARIERCYKTLNLQIWVFFSSGASWQPSGRLDFWKSNHALKN